MQEFIDSKLFIVFALALDIPAADSKLRESMKKAIIEGLSSQEFIKPVAQALRRKQFYSGDQRLPLQIGMTIPAEAGSRDRAIVEAQQVCVKAICSMLGITPKRVRLRHAFA